MKLKIAWGSHMPILMKIMDISSGDVLELGTGIFSTPYLHWQCRSRGRNLYSYDNDINYYKLVSCLESDTHKIYYIDDWNNIDIDKHWGMAFIDHKPPMRRRVDAAYLSQLADYVIIHDSSWKNNREYHLEQIWHLYKYVKHFEIMPPRTAVVSNFYDVRNIEI